MEDKKFLRLLRKAVKQDRRAFVEVCRQKSRVILYLCKGYMASQQDAEDAAQEVFLQMQLHIAELREPEAFNAWLNRLVFYTCNNMRRTMKHRTLPLDDFAEDFLADTLESFPQVMLEEDDKKRFLTQIIEDLPEKYRMCVYLHYYEDLSYAEIAGVLDTTPDAVNGYLRRARKLLKSEIEEEMSPKVYAAAPMVALGSGLKQLLGQAIAAEVPQALALKCLAQSGVMAGGAAILHLASAKVVAVALAGIATAAGVAVAVGLTPPPAGTVQPPVAVSAPAGAPSQSLLVPSQPTSGLVPDPQPAQKPGGEGDDDREEAPPQSPPGAGGPQAPSGGESTPEPGSVAPPGSVPTSSQPAPVLAPVSAEVTGAVKLVDTKQNEVALPAGLLTGTRVTLSTAEGVALAQAEVDRQGQFSFGVLEGLSPGSRLRASLHLPQDASFAPGGATPGGVRDIEVQTEGAHTLAFHIQDTLAPVCAIQLKSGDCTCGHVNPGQITLQAKDALPTQVAWQVFAANGKTALASGKGSLSAADMKNLKESLPEGLYTLQATARDAGGNQSQAAAEFRLVEGPVEPNQYD